MIAASKITMRFGQRTLFENVSVKFNPGHIYGLIGANGAGKSTFMKIMTGELDASSGDIILAPDATMSYLRQDHYAFDDQLILDVVLMGNKNLWRIHQRREELYSKTDLTESETDEIGDIEEEFDKAGGYTMEADAAKMLQGLGISEDQHFETMSSLTGGFKFRVLLAQCLFADPDVLLMDEPFGALDPITRLELQKEFKRLQQELGKTVVFVTHDIQEAFVLASRIGLMYGGEMVFLGTPEEFLRSSHPEATAFMECIKSVV